MQILTPVSVSRNCVHNINNFKNTTVKEILVDTTKLDNTNYSTVYNQSDSVILIEK